MVHMAFLTARSSGKCSSTNLADQNKDIDVLFGYNEFSMEAPLIEDDGDGDDDDDDGGYDFAPAATLEGDGDDDDDGDYDYAPAA
ncbi:conserved hypothetical protein [Ricinus communis]|uniref:Uncharacterized protein n=1 Tax=Ricinus communis TaxID=3988 RepID=B9STP4_RICCO|nr:conserved hypothetical protein [Ricinus communis]